MIVIYFLSDFLQHPFVLVCVATVFAQKAWRNYLDEKTIDFKYTIIKKIIDIKNKLRFVKFIYDRINTTHKDACKKERLKEKDYQESFKKELDKLGNLINDEIPVLEMELDSDISVYFRYTEKVTDGYEKYVKELRKINDYLVLAINSEDVMLEWCKFSFINMDVYNLAEENLIKCINNSETIYKDLRLKKI